MQREAARGFEKAGNFLDRIARKQEVELGAIQGQELLYQPVHVKWPRSSGVGGCERVALGSTGRQKLGAK